MHAMWYVRDRVACVVRSLALIFGSMKPVCVHCFQRNVRKAFMCQYPALLQGLVVASNACAVPNREGCASLKL